VDGNGVGHDGATGPLGGSAPVTDKPRDSLSPMNANDVLNCASGPPCSARQQQEALNKVLNGSGGYRQPLNSYELGSLFTQLKDIDGNGGLDPTVIADIQNGSIIPAVLPNTPPSTTLSFVLVPAWAIIPPAVIAAGGGGGEAAPPTATFSDCRRCENGNPKSEPALSGTCDSKNLTYCADYVLPEVTPIVEYRFPLCYAYAIEKTPILKIATRAHPVSSAYLFSLADDANENEKCIIEMVGPDGTPNPTVPSDNDLQVVRCDITKKPIRERQDIIISSSSLPANGYRSPAWADRNIADLSTCTNLRTTTDPTTGKSTPSNKVTIETYGQQLLAIALPFSSPWIKVADGTYARSAIAGTSSLPLTNYLPGFTAPFNSADVDTEASIPHFLTGSGAGTVAGTVQVGSAATVSATNWKADVYTTTSSNSPTTLYKQLIQKKVYKEYPAASPPPAALVLSDEITIINDATEAGYTLSSLTFSPTDAKTSYTLIIKNGSSLGNLTIDTASLNPSGSPALLLIASKITLKDPAATTIGAVIVADLLDTGTGDALHIIGNLSLSRPLVHQRKRTDSDDRKPTIFVQYSIDSYLSLLPTLGSSSREWSQVE